MVSSFSAIGAPSHMAYTVLVVQHVIGQRVHQDVEALAIFISHGTTVWNASALKMTWNCGTGCGPTCSPLNRPDLDREVRLQRGTQFRCNREAVVVVIDVRVVAVHCR